MDNRRPRRSPEQWAKLIAEFKESGETQSVFCERVGLGLSTFSRWYQRQGRASDCGAQAQASAFVDVTPPPTTPSVITVHVSEGLRIECPVSLSVESVARLARAVHDGR